LAAWSRRVVDALSPAQALSDIHLDLVIPDHVDEKGVPFKVAIFNVLGVPVIVSAGKDERLMACFVDPHDVLIDGSAIWRIAPRLDRVEPSGMSSRT